MALLFCQAANRVALGNGCNRAGAVRGAVRGTAGTGASVRRTQTRINSLIDLRSVRDFASELSKGTLHNLINF